MAMWQFDLVKLNSSEFIKWDAWVMSRPEGCVFYSTHWLRALSGIEPTVVVAKGDYNRIIGGFAFVEMPKKMGFTQIIPPVYTPFFAPFLPDKTQFEPEVREGFIRELIEFIKPFDGMRWRSFSEGDESIFGKFAIESVPSITMLLANPATAEESYSRSLKSKLSKAIKSGLITKKAIPINEVFPLVKESMALNKREVPLAEIAFIKAFEELQLVELVFTLGVYSAEGQLLAAGIYAKDLQRVYNLVIGTPRNDTFPEAASVLHHSAIEESAKLGLIFDFEGSSIPGVHTFYSRFKPQEVPINRYSFAGSAKSKLAAPILKSLGKNLY